MLSIPTFKRISALLMAAVVVVGCQSAENAPKQTVGTIIGAGLGALAGAQFGGGKGQLAAVAVGALGGAYLGSELGSSLDKADRLMAQQTTQSTLETTPVGQTQTWNNPDSGNYGTVTPTQTYQSASTELPCREYETTIYVDGRQETGVGRACRQADGRWAIDQ